MMKMIAEISMYPMREAYIPPIDDFIERLNDHANVVVETSLTATTLRGDYDDVMALLNAAIKQSYERYGVSVFVTKLIPGYDPDV